MSAQQPASTAIPESTSWQIQTIAWGEKSNIFSAPVFDQNNRLSLAYVDRLEKILKLAAHSGAAWEFTEINSDTPNLMYPSLAIDASNRLHIGFFSPETETILYGPLTDSGWVLEEAIQEVKVTALTLLIHPDGQPVLIYSDNNTRQIRSAVKDNRNWSVRELVPARVVGTLLPAQYGPDRRLHLVYNHAKDGLVHVIVSESGHRETLVIDPAAAAGRFPALALGADGTPYVSYHDPAGKALVCAVYSSGQWQKVVVDAGPDTGKYSSISVDGDHQIHISYAGEGNRTLKYATSRSGSWDIWTIDSQSVLDANTNLRFDGAGNAHILYHDGGNRSLRVASIQFQGSTPSLTAEHRFGQTFITWPERVDLQGELYRVYRSQKAIRQAADISAAHLLAETGEGSARFYANYHDEGDHLTWRSRYAENLIIQDGGMPLPDQTGLLVWTVSAQDFSGKDAGAGYYAVTVTPAGGTEQFLSGYQTGPVEEQVDAPRPVEITLTPGINLTPNRRVYIQYMDLRRWNSTFHAPNTTNSFYGFAPDTPGITRNLQYAYDYTVFTPAREDCGGKIPESIPVYVFLHGYRGNRYGEVTKNPFPFCAYGIYPIDITETWYFGFAQKHDFRAGNEIEAGDVIENFTEQRVLRMVYDLLQRAPGRRADAQRVYVFGHSMGGSGALAFAERYPDVFAAAYSGQPITNYATAGVTDKDWAADVARKWGRQALNLPVELTAPGGWGEHLRKYNRAGVWDWQNTLAGITRQSADDMAPLGIDHGTTDSVIVFPTQGEPFYPALTASSQAWGGLVNHADHEWSAFSGMPPWMGNSDEVLPFWNFSIVRNETVPGFRNARPDRISVENQGTYYNHNLLWSSSWNPWDGAPVDEPVTWAMSICAAQAGTAQCGAGESVVVDITPRRLQQFRVLPGGRYVWSNLEISSGAVVASGEVSADRNGVITVKDFQIAPGGSRLVIEAR